MSLFLMMPYGVIAAVDAMFDFDRFLKGQGLTREDMRKAKENLPEPIPLPEWARANVTTGPSQIEGVGLLAAVPFLVREAIAPARIGDAWTVAGRYANHWPNPNATVEANGETLTFVALQPIKAGAEITVNYRDVAKALSSLNPKEPQATVAS